MGSQQPPEHLSLGTELEEGVGYCGCTLLIGRMEREELRVGWEPEKPVTRQQVVSESPSG